MFSRKIMSMISLAKKAGVVKTGDFAVSYSIQNEKAKLVIVAKNAGENTIKKFANKGDYYGIEIRSYGEKELYSWALGKDNIALLAIEDTNFASKLIELIDEAKDE